MITTRVRVFKMPPTEEERKQLRDVEHSLGPLRKLKVWNPKAPSAWTPSISVPQHVINMASRQDKTLVIHSDHIGHIVQLLHKRLHSAKAPSRPYRFLYPFRLVKDESVCDNKERVIFYDRKIRHPEVKRKTKKKMMEMKK